ncbi:Gnt-II system L-idonate transporter [Rubripirellula lacrimiformis]|uniref:Gnt-II system L-idonate transporter n=1 Tax=Rubripirellula lacrimiformis TaxID=1930273 RepID=A0A517NG36_9BACT|nr:SLC13 family permease [Rubripirellula lacrimiformis]QDT06099.1 Gnt-II system L-idonate transporter [Rubripirellula lacrimiformis]
MRNPIFVLILFLAGTFLLAVPGFGAEDVAAAAADSTGTTDLIPVLLLVVGIASVLGMIIGLKLNAFLALIISALVVSLGVGLVDGQDAGSRMNAVVNAFGNSAGGIGIVIAMAAIIGKCMLDSGAADRVVRSAVKVTGEKKASLGLMFSGFVLAIPVFFDTVFYLLVPLARSLYRRTNRNYLRYLMAIATGGAITHTLVPPTPGPLLVSAILGVDIGMMMLVGVMVAIPAAIVGLIFSIVIDKRMPIAMRSLGGGEEKHKALMEHDLPSLWVSLLPVFLPVVLIGAGTLATTLADNEDRARVEVADIQDYDRLATLISDAPADSPAGRLVATKQLSDADRERLSTPATDDQSKAEVTELLNHALLGDDLYDETAYLGVPISKIAKNLLSADQLRMKPIDRRRMNRVLLEDAYPNLIAVHQWESPARNLANRLALWSNANFALLLAAICAMLTLKFTRSLSWRALGDDVEESLMSGGVIILITAAGGAFGAMLQDTNISTTIREFFSGQDASGISLLVLGWAIAAVLKVAQGSSTVAMIIGAGMMSAIIGDSRPDYNLVYVATAVGTGSLMGSWMNDSGFWVFTKMGGLTESESLKSWTPLLAVLSLTGLTMTIIFSQVFPFRGNL